MHQRWNGLMLSIHWSLFELFFLAATGAKKGVSMCDAFSCLLFCRGATPLPETTQHGYGRFVLDN